MVGKWFKVSGDKRSLTVLAFCPYISFSLFRSCNESLLSSRLPVGLTGDILINENGDREADYTLNDMDPETGFMVPVATYYGARKAYEASNGYVITWPSKGNQAPKDVPVCGFEGEAEACRPPGEGNGLRSLLS